jgi:Na+/melibiose symporter-like transporter
VLVLVAAWLTLRYSLTEARHREIRKMIDSEITTRETPA